MHRRLLKSLIVAVSVTTATVVSAQDSPSSLTAVAEWLRSRMGNTATPFDLRERGEVVLFDGVLDALPLKPRLAPLGGGQMQFPVTDQVYRGLPSWMILTAGHGSGGQLIFARPLRFAQPLNNYELTITLVPPVPTEISVQPTGQPGVPGVPGTPNAPVPGAPGSEGEVSGAVPGAPPGMPPGSAPGYSAPGVPGYGAPVPGYGAPGGFPGGFPFGAPGYGPGFGPMFGVPFGPTTAGRRTALRRYLILGQMTGGLMGMGPMGGAPGYGGMPGPSGMPGYGEIGPGAPSGGFGSPGTPQTPPTRQPIVIRTLKYLSFALVTDKGVLTLSVRVPPDDTLTFDGNWATVVVPLQLMGNAPEPPVLLYRLGISGDAPEELYIARITLRQRTPDQPFVQLRSSALAVPAPGGGDKPLLRYQARVNQPVTMEVFVTGTVLPMEVRWDFSPDNGTHFELPDRRGRQVSFTFEKPGVYDCAVQVRDIYGLLPPIVERFQVEVR